MNRLTVIPMLALLFLPSAAFSDTDTDIITADPDNGTVTNGTENGTDIVTTDPDNGTLTNGFDAMSPGNKMIARSLMDAQIVSAEGNEIWTLDQIAAAKSETGWGQVFQQMQADGVIEAKNLGMVVSSYVRNSHGAMPDWVAVETGQIGNGNDNDADVSPDNNEAGVNSNTTRSMTNQLTGHAQNANRPEMQNPGQGAVGSNRIPGHAAVNAPVANNGGVVVNQGTDVDVVTGVGRGGGANVNVTTAAGGNAGGNSFAAGNRIGVSASNGVTTGSGVMVGAGNNNAGISAAANSAAAGGAGHAAVSAGGGSVNAAAAASVNAATAAGGAAGGPGQGFAHGRNR